MQEWREFARCCERMLGLVFRSEGDSVHGSHLSNSNGHGCYSQLQGRPRFFSHFRTAASIATHSETSIARHGSAKVSDRVLEMTAIDEDGQRHHIKGLTGHTLLRTLVERGLFDPERHRLEDITACGGECEVSIANEWLDKLPPRTEDEVEVLKDKTHAKKADPHARLGCQIILEPELEGMVVSIAEEEPWRTL